MEVAPLHRTVDITQKRVLFKNTKKTKKDTKGIVGRRTWGEHEPLRLRRKGHNIVFGLGNDCQRLPQTDTDYHRLP